MKKNKLILTIILLSVVFASCDRNKVYEKYIEIDDYVWQYDNQIKFEFDVKSHGGEYFVVRSVEDIAEIIGVKIR